MKIMKALKTLLMMFMHWNPEKLQRFSESTEGFLYGREERRLRTGL